MDMWDFIKDKAEDAWWGFKGFMESNGFRVVVVFVGLCWLYFASFIDMGTAAIAAVGILFVLFAWLSYRFLSMFMR